ncbi:SGNH/GDSL hydrolase family protein [Pseudomonas sp. Irchel s3a18]|uniref:SGNH/GDSL hydrolase family protein n=1 Tax=Pseudomonas sp. Irchel s3a18 TaxID=2009053 RepID=UPI000BA2F04E|nr:SGNH/GDSL hydrolase family protein [Pseudomonas sp. Irchel s3a18]
MQQIMVYSDSLSWGIIPGTRQRMKFQQRWPGVLEQRLIAAGREVRIVEDCLNGRRTAMHDPLKPGRHGGIGLAQQIEAQSPLALVILMLGTNDFQSMHSCAPNDSVAGMSALIDCVREAPIEPGMPVPPILLVAPPPIIMPKGDIAIKFGLHAARSKELSSLYCHLAQERSCAFFDAGRCVQVSDVDGVHMEFSAHAVLGEALAHYVLPLLDGGSTNDGALLTEQSTVTPVVVDHK